MVRSHWAHLTERGSRFGLRMLVLSYRLFGERLVKLLLYPVVTYFFLTGRQARTASLNYLKKVSTQMVVDQAPSTGVRANWCGSFHHMMMFAQSALDKLAAWTGVFDHGRIIFPERHAFDALLTSGRGALLIASHLGSIEMTRALATNAQRAVVNAVVYTDQAQNFNQTLEQANGEFGVNLIQVSHFGPDTAIMLKEKIDRGELVVIVGDRTPPADSGRVSQAQFLGALASFAQGPWILASLLECPVYLFFCLQQQQQYEIHFEAFVDQIKLPRKTRQESLQVLIQQYASRLQVYCLKAPYQWFNFYDFWQEEKAPIN